MQWTNSTPLGRAMNTILSIVWASTFSLEEQEQSITNWSAKKTIPNNLYSVFMSGKNDYLFLWSITVDVGPFVKTVFPEWFLRVLCPSLISPFASAESCSEPLITRYSSSLVYPSVRITLTRSEWALASLASSREWSASCLRKIFYIIHKNMEWIIDCFISKNQICFTLFSSITTTKEHRACVSGKSSGRII